MPSFRRFLAAALLLALCFPASPVEADKGPYTVPYAPPRQPAVNQIIVKLKAPDSWERVLSAGEMASLSLLAGDRLSYFRRMGGGAHVLRLPRWMSMEDATAIADRIALDPLVEYAEPDRILRPTLTPNDTLFNSQWHYKGLAQGKQGVNLMSAWDYVIGDPNIVIAVLDTGLLQHTDIYGEGRVLPGYDMISDDCTAGGPPEGGDISGRDGNPFDWGDFTYPGQCGDFSRDYSDSSWHGTHVMGTVGARSHNARGVTGVDWKATLLPVRVLGRGGGAGSDIIDGMRWAAGLAVPNVPTNAFPARVINMSLGGDGPCGAYQSAIDAVVAAGAVVVVAAGNEDDLAANHVPANCDKVITVAATDGTGQIAPYSNYGSTVEISAPGGNYCRGGTVLSTLDSGLDYPNENSSYGSMAGTSMAAPHVAGIAALLLAVNPYLAPTQIRQVLQTTARPPPQYGTASGCPGGDGNLHFAVDCTGTLCGAGIIDATAAVLSIADTVPEPFSFMDQTGLVRSQLVTSDPIALDGVNVRVPITVTGGKYSIDGGAFTSSPGRIGDNQSFRVQHMTSAAYNTPVNTTLTIGGVSDVFTTTTAPDSTPNAFKFTDRINVVPNEVIVSNAVLITGLSVSAPVSVTAGEYSIGCDGNFVSTPGMIANNQRICVRHVAAANPASSVHTLLTVGGASGAVSDTFSSTTVAAPDSTPNAFAFMDRANVALNVQVVSNAVTLLGFNVPVPISVTGTGGAYSIGCNGNFTGNNGNIYPGQKVCVRHASAPTPGTTVDTVLTVGGVSDTFRSTTVAVVDTAPNPFVFIDQTGVGLAVPVTSNVVTVGGINTATSIEIGGGSDASSEYSVGCNGVFTSTAGSILPGQKFCVRHTSSGTPGGNQTHTTLVIGGAIQDTFTSATTTLSADMSPNAFAFIDRVNVGYGVHVVSNALIIGGINTPTPIEVAGGSDPTSEYSLGCNGVFTNASSTILPGQKFCVRHVSSGAAAGTAVTRLTIGDRLDEFKTTTTTAAMDSVPTAFKFTDRSNVEHAVTIVSNALVISGFNTPVSVTVSGGEYSIGCNGVFTSSAGNISPGEKVCVRHVSASQPGAWVDTTLSLSGVADVFSSVTRNGPTNTQP